MKKIIIVNDNLHLGGIQKSLVNLLNAVHNEYEITLLLLNKNGELISKIPDNVKIISACRTISVLGAHKKELKKNIFGYVWKGFLLLMARRMSKRVSFTLAGMFQRKLKKYDVAISYSHPSKMHDLRSCSAEFVLNKIDAAEKICFVHADYQNESNRCEYTDSVYKLFDKIVCCSESVRHRFIDALPELDTKAYAVRNFYDLSLCNNTINGYKYDNGYVNVVSVARLTAEKGIERAVEALYNSKRRDIRYYIVGEGPERKTIENSVNRYVLGDQVFLLGESGNPEMFMKNADFLLVSSYHEAAPIVFDEAKLLGLSVITTETTSAIEMVGSEGGIVCVNSTEGITSVFLKLTQEDKRRIMFCNNELQKNQFYEMLYS